MSLQSSIQKSVVPKSKVPYLKVDSNVRHLLPDWGELWSYREMLYFLITRDIKIRYRQTVIGAAWAVIQPLTTMIVFTIIFGQFAKIPSNDIPYPIFSFAALVPWTFFSNSIGLAAESMVGQAHLVRKVYFPRMYIPLSRILGGLFDIALSLIMLLILMVIFKYTPTTGKVMATNIYTLRLLTVSTYQASLWAIVVIPLLILLMTIVCLGLGLWLSALNVNYRDVRYLVPYILQILTYLTPVAYPTNIISEPLRTIYSMNPMVTVIEGFRWALLGQTPPSTLSIIGSLITTAIVFLSGFLYFNYVEGNLSDTV
jgi:lipopolysaccharide transport system permease protein